MQQRVFRAPPGDGVLLAPLDEFTAVFHRASGITHLLTEPAPQILAALTERGTESGAEGGLSLDTLLDRLGRDYDLTDGTREALAARLDELVESGLVEYGLVGAT
ncbi:MAG TPA: HPr-rel-A system PqqD family peptide chaperone [Sphingomonas sp.]|nr:HPr-rel-A system PqqD family peptide chaperone [Sphingomonas sp.]